MEHDKSLRDMKSSGEKLIEHTLMNRI